MKYSVETLPRMDADIKKKAGLYTNNTFKGENNFEKVPKVNGIELPTNDLNGTNYLMVYGTGTPTENANELQAAYNAAKTMTKIEDVYTSVISISDVYADYILTKNTTLNLGEIVVVNDSVSAVVSNNIVSGRVTLQFSDTDTRNYAISSSSGMITSSRINKITIIVAPGVYTFGETKFKADASGIDVVSLTGNADVKLDGIVINTTIVYIKGINTEANQFAINEGSAPLISLENCIGGDHSFAYGDEFSGKAVNCIGGVGSFGGNDGGMNGTLVGCTITSGDFPTPTGAGKIINCIDGNGKIINSQSLSKYKVLSGIFHESAGVVTYTILENTIGDVVITREDAGIIKVANPIFTDGNSVSPQNYTKCVGYSDNSYEFKMRNGTNGYVTLTSNVGDDAVGDLFESKFIEIRVY